MQKPAERKSLLECRMSWKRALQFLVVTSVYSFILSLIYVTLTYKPTEPIPDDGQRFSRQNMESSQTHMSDTSLSKTTATRKPSPNSKKAPVVARRLQHEGYVDMLTGEPLRLFCSSCAVVSSSGHLLNTSSGPAIDATECVFRMNNAPVRGFESDVGQRTTLRSIAHVNLARSFEKADGTRKELLEDEETRSDYLLVNWMNRVNVRKLQDREYRYAVLLAHLYPGVKFFAFNSDQMRYAEKVFRDETGLTRQQANTWLSTGWFTMIAAMDICNDITVYGMANDDYCSSTSKDSGRIPYHYYEPSGMRECAYYNVSETRLDGGHLFITEKAVFRRWAFKHHITFKHPSWVIGPESAEPLDSPFLRRYRQLMNETNYAIRSVRDYVRLEREARRRVQQEERTIELQRGNETFIIKKKQLMQRVLELIPGAKPIIGRSASKTVTKTRKDDVILHHGKPRDKLKNIRNNSRRNKRAKKTRKDGQINKRNVKDIMNNDDISKR